MDANLIKRIPSRKIDRFSHMDNLKARCAYHSNEMGHHTDKCWALKRKIKDLIDKGILQQGATQNPFIHSAPSRHVP